MKLEACQIKVVASRDEKQEFHSLKYDNVKLTLKKKLKSGLSLHVLLFVESPLPSEYIQQQTRP